MGRIGIAKFILRETQHLCAVEGIGDALVLSTLRLLTHWSNRRRSTFQAARTSRRPNSIWPRCSLRIWRAEWEPSRYEDDYRENLMRVIKAKMKGKEPTLVVDERPRDANVIDLMERLRQSLDRSGGRNAKKAAQTATTRKTARARKQRRKGHAAA